MKNRIMIDLETLGVSSSPVILSIGAVRFDLNGVRDDFYQRIEIASCTAVELKIDPETVMWWMQQSDEARKALFSQECSTVYLVDALLALDAWAIGSHGQVDEIWGNGASSDNVWIANAFKAIDYKPGWDFRADRCYRTLKNLYPDVSLPEKQGAEHNAVDDARFQALHCIELLKAAEVKE